jgi:hypothetical protein
MPILRRTGYRWTFKWKTTDECRSGEDYEGVILQWDTRLGRSSNDRRTRESRPQPRAHACSGHLEISLIMSTADTNEISHPVSAFKFVGKGRQCHCEDRDSSLTSLRSLRFVSFFASLRMGILHSNPVPVKFSLIRK